MYTNFNHFLSDRLLVKVIYTADTLMIDNVWNNVKYVNVSGCCAALDTFYSLL